MGAHGQQTPANRGRGSNLTIFLLTFSWKKGVGAGNPIRAITRPVGCINFGFAWKFVSFATAIEFMHPTS
jgi:hypothetical protein